MKSSWFSGWYSRHALSTHTQRRAIPYTAIIQVNTRAFCPSFCPSVWIGWFLWHQKASISPVSRSHSPVSRSDSWAIEITAGHKQGICLKSTIWKKSTSLLFCLHRSGELSHLQHPLYGPEKHVVDLLHWVRTTMLGFDGLAAGDLKMDGFCFNRI